jgi:hypothetical protein
MSLKGLLISHKTTKSYLKTMEILILSKTIIIQRLLKLHKIRATIIKKIKTLLITKTMIKRLHKNLRIKMKMIKEVIMTKEQVI